MDMTVDKTGQYIPIFSVDFAQTLVCANPRYAAPAYSHVAFNETPLIHISDPAVSYHYIRRNSARRSINEFFQRRFVRYAIFIKPNHRFSPCNGHYTIMETITDFGAIVNKFEPEKTANPI
jgi:hypothetical protein